MGPAEVRAKREELGLTQKEFAAALGMGASGERTIRRWESGETHPTAVEATFISQFGHVAPFAQDETREPKFTFCDLFAGIGGIRIPFQELGGGCVFSCEWDRFAQKTYRMNFGETPAGDIRQIDSSSMPDFDVLLAGFPCQPFSLAGVSKKNSLGRPTGFEDKTQGTLFFDVARIIRDKRPKAFLLENVKNLTSHDKGRTFRVIYETLADELGYDVHYKVLDSRDWTCQHRERIYIVGFDSDASGFDWDEIERPAERHVLGEILEDDPDPRFTLSDKLWDYLRAYKAKHAAAGHGFGYSVFGPGDTTRTLSARYHKDGSEILVRQDGKNPRKLTPRECARLQGFPDEFIIPVSDTQAYKQFGNSVSVPTVRAVARLMMQEYSRIYGAKKSDA